MQIPTFYGEPLAVYSRMTLPDSPIHLYHYTYKQIPLKGDLNTIDRLTAQGYERVIGKDNVEGGLYTASLFSQLFDVVYVQDGNHFMPWAHSTSIAHVKKYPVCLAFQTDEATTQNEDLLAPGHIQMLQFLPLPRHGEYAMIGLGPDVKLYAHPDLGEKGTALKVNLGKTIIELSGGTPWGTFSDVHALCVSELKYTAIKRNLHVDILNSRGKVRKEAQENLIKLEQFHKQVVDLRQSWLRPDWLEKWAEVRSMAQELAANYYQHHKDVTKKTQPRGMAPLTSSHQTRLPSNNGYRGIEEAFGPALIRRSLWEDQNMEHQIETPNGSLLKIRGQEDFERRALTQYINDMIGVEGLKHTLILLETLFTQTGARDRRDDAHISLRQLLMRMGYNESKADDIEERKKLAHTILYLARTWVTSQETKYEQEVGPRGGKRGGGGRKKRGVEYTPLFVIEKMRASEDGGLDVPDEVKFHLGEDFYNSMFGPGGQFFYLPTLQILNYHAKNEQQELCLAFYLTNMIYIAKSFTRHFREMALQSGLLSVEEMDTSSNRIRSALRIVYALERLERDGLIKRGAHEALDSVLAVEYITQKNTIVGLYSPSEIAEEKDAYKKLEMQFSSATLKRIQKQYAYLQGKSIRELNDLRRKGLQRLLREVHEDAILFSPGPVTSEGVERREKQRQQAIDTNENAMIARVIKGATKQVAKNASKIVNADENHK